MNGAKDGQPVPSQECEIPESDAPQTMKAEIETEYPNDRAFGGAEKLSLKIERFSGLSSEIIALLTGLSQEISKSTEELKAVRSAVDLKRKELEALHETEKSATVLERQIEDLRRQKENLERLIADQRSGWEGEKLRRAHEEKEYIENRKTVREREEEEYKKAWAAEQLKSRQMLEEELNAIRQRSQEAREAAERDFLNRELILTKKELEWRQLILELEQFLSKLARRTNPHIAPHGALLKEDPAARSGASASSAPVPGNLHIETGSSDAGSEFQSGLNSEEVLMWENIWEGKGITLDDKEIVSGNDLTEELNCSPSSLKDLHILQGRRVEDSNSGPSAKQDSTPIKFSPKKP